MEASQRRQEDHFRYVLSFFFFLIVVDLFTWLYCHQKNKQKRRQNQSKFTVEFFLQTLEMSYLSHVTHVTK